MSLLDKENDFLTTDEQQAGLSTLNRTTFIRSIAGIELELSN